MRPAALALTLALLAAILAAPPAARAADDPLEALATAFKAAADRAAPAVVQVLCERPSGGGDLAGPGPSNIQTIVPVPPEVLDRFQENRYMFVRPEGPASGVVVGPDGYVLTALYNVAGRIANLRVVLADGRVFPATVLGQDANLDVALLKIEATGLAALAVSPEAVAVPGQFSLTVGRGASAQDLHVNQGIVSAVIRARGDAIQTSARVNYANSGGAMVDLDGRLLGVIVRIGHDYTRNRSGINTGVGFAAPSPKIAAVLATLKAGRSIAPRPTPFLGIKFDPSYPAQPNDKGVKIEYVYKGFPGERAGLKPGDVLVNFEYVDIETRNDLVYVIQQCDVDQRVTFSVLRGEEALDLEAALTARPGPERTLGMSREYLEGKTPMALGIRVDLDAADGPGVLVTHVHEGFPLHQGGLKAGDVLLGVYGLKDFPGWLPVFYLEYLDRALPYCFEGAKVAFWVWRDGRGFAIPLVIGRIAPDDRLAAMDREFEAARAAGALARWPAPDVRTAIAQDAVRWKVLLHLGVELGALTDEGWVVDFVHAGFPGQRAGLETGDRLLSIGGDRVRRGPRWYRYPPKAVAAKALPGELKFLTGDIEGASSHWLPGDPWTIESARDGETRKNTVNLGDYPEPAILLALEAERTGNFATSARYGADLKAALANRSAPGRLQALRALVAGTPWSGGLAKTLVELFEDRDRVLVREASSVLERHGDRETFELVLRSLPVADEDVSRNRWQDKLKLDIVKAHLDEASFDGDLPDFGLNGKLWQRWWKENRDKVRFPR